MSKEVQALVGRAETKLKLVKQLDEVIMSVYELDEEKFERPWERLSEAEQCLIQIQKDNLTQLKSLILMEAVSAEKRVKTNSGETVGNESN